MSAGPGLSLCFIFSIIHATVLLWGVFRFNELLTFCQATNTSTRYHRVKNCLLLCIYVYPALFVVSLTFMWVGYDQKWEAGYFFMILPFLSLLVFFITLLITRNDVSNYVDVHRAARGKLPYQPMPTALVVGTGPSSPSRNRPPPTRLQVPVQEEDNDDEILFGGDSSLGMPPPPGSSPPRHAMVHVGGGAGGGPRLPVADNGNYVGDDDAF